MEDGLADIMKTTFNYSGHLLISNLSIKYYLIFGFNIWEHCTLHFYSNYYEILQKSLQNYILGLE